MNSLLFLIISLFIYFFGLLFVVAEVYDESYASIVRTLRSAHLLPEDWEPGDDIPIPSSSSTSDMQLNSSSSPTHNTKRYQYKWDNENSEIFGPYDAKSMANWLAAGYFQDSVLVKEIGPGSSGVYRKITEVDFNS